ncbi:MAG: hypothetical protein IJ190_08750 [Prevotella sp.]|nr:hypothetical protein [Prevotella sp.]
MKDNEHIITIRRRDKNLANKAFDDFMRLSEREFNNRSINNPNLYKGISPSQLEEVSRDLLKDIAPQTPFRPDDIVLISGHSFPDIMATDYYGVKVKSTKDDKWYSLGSSIVESTRNATVENIYMLFGKLGGNPPEFRCKPYFQCLSEISVTHSPRYHIDMELSDRENIFSKMNTPYDTFRLLEEKDKISRVRNYYITKAKEEGKNEFPWWLEEATSINLAFYNDLSIQKRNELMIRCYIIFYSMYDSDPQLRYKTIALWLCNHYSLLCPNMRDFFSAGGTCSINVDGKLHTFPHIVGEVLDKTTDIKNLLDNPDSDIIKDIECFWDFTYDRNDLFRSWLLMLEKHFSNNKTLKDVPIRKLIEERI